MIRILQVNVTANWGSTGRIAEQIGEKLIKNGWDSYIAYGRYMNVSQSKLIKVGGNINVYEHFLENRLFDNEGLASRISTKKFIEKIKLIKPDIIHLHNIHDHWLNYRILFQYLNNTDIKIVWTFHDFWAITGHCAHFVDVDCYRYQIECCNCPLTKDKFLPIIKKCRKNFFLKSNLFTANKNLTIVPVSDWVAENVRMSFLKNNRICVVPNGIDTNIFRPIVYEFNLENINEKWSIMNLINRLKDKFVIMAVATQWKSNKGLEDYMAMAKILKEDEIIVLVGVSEKVSKKFPPNIIGIQRINNQHELAILYTRADVVTSFSSAETFGLTIVEGLACGTPAVVYNNTAPPTLITSETGYIVSNKDYIKAYSAIQSIRDNGKSYYTEACIRLVKEKYDKDICLEAYLKLYKELINKG